jgi:acyl dehydratase
MTLKAHELTEGQTFEQVVAEDLTRTQIVMYSGASGDFNPLHHDEVLTVAAGYPSTFAHGMLTMGLSGKPLTETVGDGNLVKYGCRFTSQVWPGAHLDGNGDSDGHPKRERSPARRSCPANDEPERHRGAFGHCNGGRG